MVAMEYKRKEKRMDLDQGQPSIGVYANEWCPL